MPDQSGGESTLADDLRLLPGHGPGTNIEIEPRWLDGVGREWRLPF